MLRFHQATCELLGMPPVVDLPTRATIAERERRLGVKLPASVAEWYSLPGAVNVLVGATDDHAMRIEELGEPFDGWGKGPRDLLEEGLLVIRTENQGVCNWAVRLDDGVDPRVLIEVDSKPDLVIWRLHAASFSDYVLTLAWDRLAFGLPFGLAAQDSPLERHDLALLERGFEQQDRTWGWPGHTNYRFERGEGRVIVWDGEGQADWWLFAPTAEALAGLASTLWSCGGLASSLYAACRDPAVQDVAEEVLAALRAGQPGHGAAG
jgi:hypothetical protein